MYGVLIARRRWLFATIALFIILGGYFYYATYVLAATRTWDGGGATNDWSDCDNWSSNTCPGSSDIAAFDGTSTKDATVDGSFAGSVAGVDINSGYTGTITQARDLTVDSSNYNQAAGIWDQTTYDILVDDGDFILSAGTFHSGTSSSNTVEDSFTYSGGTFAAASTSVWTFAGVNNTGVFTYDGEFPATFSLNKTNSGGLTIAAGTTVSNVGVITDARFFTIASGATIHFSDTSVNVDGLRISGTTTASSTINVGTNNFILNSTGYLDFAGSQISTESDYTDNGGTFDETGVTILMDGVNQSGTFSFSGVFPGTVSVNKTNSGGVTIAAGATIPSWGTFTDASFLTIQNGAQVNFGNTAISQLTNLYLSGRMTASSTINIVDGRPRFYNTGYFDYAGSDFTSEEGLEYYSGHTIVSTDWVLTTDGTSNFDDGTITTTAPFPVPVAINNPGGGASMFISSGSDIMLATSSSNGSVSISGTVDTQGNDFTASSISLNGSATTLKVAGHETVTTPSIGEDATVEYTGSGTYSSLIVGTNYENLIFSGGGTYNITTNVNVEDDFTSTNNSNFNQTSGTVILDGTAQTVTGTSTFAGLTKAVTSATTLTFGANQEQTVNGTLTLTGSDGNQLTVVSDTPGTQYQLDMNSLRNLEYLNVTDLHNTNTDTAYCFPGCTNGGNTTNLLFSEDPEAGKLYWDNDGGDNLWSNCTNWKFNICPDSTTIAAFDNRATANATVDLDFEGVISGLSIESGYNGSITSDRSLTIGSDGYQQVAGTFTAHPSVLIVDAFSQTGGTFTANNTLVQIEDSSNLTTAASTAFHDMAITGSGTADADLVRYYSFDENAANTSVQDTTGNDDVVASTNTENLATSTAKRGLAFEFNGTNEYVCLDDAGTCSTDTSVFWDAGFTTRSIALWFKADNVTTRQMLFEEGGGSNGMNIYIRNGSVYGGAWSESTGWAGQHYSQAISPNQWYHVAIVFSSTDFAVYVDGVSIGNVNPGASMNAHTGDDAIGAMINDTQYDDGDSTGDGDYYGGIIDEFRVYTDALTAGEVAQLANNVPYLNPSGTVILSNNTLDINNDFLIASGTALDASTNNCSSSSCDIELAGDWNNEGLFRPRTGAVTLDGSGQSVSGDTVFYDLTKSVTSPETLTFGAGDTFILRGKLILNGTAGNLLTATSSSDGVAWQLNANTFNSTIEYVALHDSNQIGYTEMYCFPGCIDGGNNTNWLFIEKPIPREIYRIQGGTRLRGNIRF